MNITLLVKRPRKISIINIGVKTFSVVGVGIMLMVGVVVYSSYYVGTTFGIPPESARLAYEDHKDQEAVEDLRLRQEQVNAMALRLSQMQAHVLRLNALGKRLTEIANLRRGGEFNFETPPAQGGPLVGKDSVDTDDILRSLDDFSKTLETRENQLLILEKLLLNKKLHDQVFPSGWPIRKGWISSYFGMRTDPFTGKRARHEGVDFAGKDGAEIVAVASGVVIFSGKKYGYGQIVIVNHGNGYTTRYGHNKKNIVKRGDRVEKGQTLALMGSSGRSTGPHVHFEVLKNNKVVNPIKFIQAAR